MPLYKIFSKNSCRYFFPGKSREQGCFQSACSQIGQLGWRQAATAESDTPNDSSLGLILLLDFWAALKDFCSWRKLASLKYNSFLKVWKKMKFYCITLITEDQYFWRCWSMSAAGFSSSQIWIVHCSFHCREIEVRNAWPRHDIEAWHRHHPCAIGQLGPEYKVQILSQNCAIQLD